MKAKYIYLKIRGFWPLVCLNLVLLLLLNNQGAFLVIDAIRDSYNPIISYLIWFTSIVSSLYFGVWPIVSDIAQAFWDQTIEENEEGQYSVRLPSDRVLNGLTLSEVELTLQGLKGKDGQGSVEYWMQIRKQFTGVSDVIVMHANNQIKTSRNRDSSPSPTVNFHP